MYEKVHISNFTKLQAEGLISLVCNEPVETVCNVKWYLPTNFIDIICIILNNATGFDSNSIRKV